MPGDIWASDEVELPTNAIFVYKARWPLSAQRSVGFRCTSAQDSRAPPPALQYIVAQQGVPSNVKTWQTGNNQALLLSAKDQPLLHVVDSWTGDSASAYTCAVDGACRWLLLLLN